MNTFDLKKYLIENRLQENKDTLNEARGLEGKVADLYGYAGIKTEYDDELVKRYGKEVINFATQMAPKLIEYKKHLKNIAQEMKNSPEAKMLLSIMNAARGYGGMGSGYATLGDLINHYSKNK